MTNNTRYTVTDTYSISRILKGGWQLSQGHSGMIDKEQAIADMFAFVKEGITTFDFGDIYTGVEELIGEFLRRYKKQFGKKRLSEIQLHTKFVPDLSMLSTISKEYVEKIIDRSLLRLDVEQLDLVQFHWWDYDIPRYMEVALYLQKLQERGKIRYLGVTNFDISRMKELLATGMSIHTTQVQYSLLDHRPEHGLINFCRQHNIKLLCYGTVAGGFLSEKYLGQEEPAEQLENRSLVKYKLIIDEFGGWKLFQELLQTLHVIAQKHNVSITNVASRYILDKPDVAGIIIGARNSNHIENNRQAFTLRLDIEDMKAINKVLQKAQGPEGDIYDLERIKGGKHASIMKYNLNKK